MEFGGYCTCHRNPDPIGYDDQVNLYAYVGNDPVNGVDPDGMEGEFYCAKVGIGCDHVMTPAERERQQETAKNVGTTAAIFIPLERAFAGVAWFGRTANAWRLERLAANHKNALGVWNAAWKRAGFGTATEVGGVIGWGTKPGAALRRASEIDRSSVAEMRNNGLTRDLAIAARDLYKATSDLKSNSVAAERLQLMNKILRNW